MRKLFAALIIAAITSFAVPAMAADNIKVLILSKNFNTVPDADEKISRMDKVKGDLIIGGNSYRGQIEVWRGTKGLYLINILPLEDYVEGVVGSEIGPDWSLEAIKAQAVIARTYALYNILKNGNGKRFHLTSSVLHQAFNGRNKNPLVAQAVKETRGQILKYEGGPIEAFYHSTSGGLTELPEEVFSKSYPYLKSVPADSSLSPYNIWTRRIPLSEIERATGIKNIRDIQIASLTATGRAKEVTIASNPDSIDVEAKELRKLLGWKRLPSTMFTVAVEDGIATFEGSGFGHGVGLCQWSSQSMALEGKTYGEILSHFYPGAELSVNENIGL